MFHGTLPIVLFTDSALPGRVGGVRRYARRCQTSFLGPPALPVVIAEHYFLHDGYPAIYQTTCELEIAPPLLVFVSRIHSRYFSVRPAVNVNTGGRQDYPLPPVSRS